jgi:hypothetical protein
MLQLKNGTPFAAKMALFPDENGIDTLYVIAMSTFGFGGGLTLNEQPEPPLEDIYWGAPESSSLKLASCFHPLKPATDVLMLGHAFTPEERPRRELQVSLVVGDINKAIKVFGDRCWQRGNISPAEPFTSMPLVYERAYGGSQHIGDERFLAEEKNPVGTGFAGRRGAKEMEGIPLPNLEDPKHLIRHWKDQPTPACFAFSSPNWQPRVAYAGTYDEHWQHNVAPYLPHDFDSRFFNSAHPELIYPGFLKGGEAVSITGMHPEGKLSFHLPTFRIGCRVLTDGVEHSSHMQIESLILQPNALEFSLIWKAAVACDKQSTKINEVNLLIEKQV